METRTMSRTHTVVASPIGPLTVVREDGALVRLAMSPPGRFVDAEIGERSDEGFDDVVRQLGEYFAGERTAFDLPLRPVGSGFELAVWD
jgi:methylated-DNA-[protein]-cysteine S-methyltransferase